MRFMKDNRMSDPTSRHSRLSILRQARRLVPRCSATMAHQWAGMSRPGALIAFGSRKQMKWAFLSHTNGICPERSRSIDRNWISALVPPSISSLRRIPPRLASLTNPEIHSVVIPRCHSFHQYIFLLISEQPHVILFSRLDGALFFGRYRRKVSAPLDAAAAIRSTSAEFAEGAERRMGAKGSPRL